MVGLRTTVLLAVWVCSACLAILGCSTASTPQVRYYRLGVEKVAPSHRANPPAPLLQGVLAVERLTPDGLIGERPILYSEDGRGLEVHQHHYHYWIEPPADMVREQLAAYLRARNTAKTVVTPEMRIRPDYFIRGRLTRFERVIGDGRGRVVIEADLALKEVASRRLRWMDTYRAEIPSEGGDILDSVEAFNRGLGDLFARFLEDISRR
jgi:cholesterol transport system auxiliary component